MHLHFKFSKNKILIPYRGKYLRCYHNDPLKAIVQGCNAVKLGRGEREVRTYNKI